MPTDEQAVKDLFDPNTELDVGDEIIQSKTEEKKATEPEKAEPKAVPVKGDVPDDSQKLRDELSATKNELGMYRTLIENLRQEALRQQQKPEPEPEPEREVDFLSNPSVAIEKAVKKAMESERERSRYENAFRQAEYSKAMAKQRWPGVFEGVNEAELNQALYGGVQSKVIAPETLNNPAGWAMAAWQLRGQKMDFKMPAQTAVPTPTETEVPGGGTYSRPPEKAPKPPEGWDEIWQRMGINDKQEEIMKDFQRRRG